MHPCWKHLLVLSLLAAAVSAGCDDDDSDNPDAGQRDASGQDATTSTTTDGGSSDGGGLGGESFQRTVIATGLSQPFEMTMGPDDMLWVTERTGKRVVRISPDDGAKKTILELPEALVTEGTQDGVLGMALHPELLQSTGNNFVYIAYTYDADPDTATTAVDRRVRIRSYVYNTATEMLEQPVTLIEGLHGSVDHNSGRVVFGPDAKLYYSIGDQGANQYSLYCEENLAQALPTRDEVTAEDWRAYRGKILRMNLDGTIPDDNPTLAGVRSHIYSYGHRNAQGLTFSSSGMLYETEHGPKSDDELNLIKAGKNYGWPNVAGFRDDKAYVWANWSASTNPPCNELEYSDFSIPASVPQQMESEFDDPQFTEPMATFHTVENGFNFMDPMCAENMNFYICWPTIAPSSIAIYENTTIPGWANSALITTLKHGTLYRVPLDSSGNMVSAAEIPYFTSTNRYRDVAISADGKTLYLATDSMGLVRDSETMRPTTMLDDPGAIIRFTFMPDTP